MNKSAADLKKNYLEFTELRYILKKSGQFFEEAQVCPCTIILGMYNTIIMNVQDHSPTRREIRRVSVVDPRLMRRFSAVPGNQAEMNIPLDPVTDIK